MISRFVRFEGLRRALASRNYLLWTLGNSVSLLGTWMHKVGVAWLTWEMTHSGAWLGAVAFADMIPSLVVTPLAGVLADRWDRLKVTRFSQAAMMADAALIYGLTIGGVMTVEVLTGLVALMGAMHALGQPARLALIPNLVRPDSVTAAVAINSLIFNVARFVGPAIAGLVIVAFGVAATFLANALSFAAFLWALFSVRVETADRVAAGPRRNILADMAEGLVFAARHKGIGPGLLLLGGVSCLARPAFELLAGFADHVFGWGAAGLSILTSAVGFGAIVAGLRMTAQDGLNGLVPVMLKSAFLSGAGVLVFSLTHSLWIAVPAIAAAGYGLIGFGIASQTLIQMTVSARMRGRVVSLYGALNKSGPALGALAMGVLSERFGLQPPVAGGAILVLIGLVWAWRLRAHLVQHLETTGPGDAKTSPAAPEAAPEETLPSPGASPSRAAR